MLHRNLVLHLKFYALTSTKEQQIIPKYGFFDLQVDVFSVSSPM